MACRAREDGPRAPDAGNEPKHSPPWRKRGDQGPRHRGCSGVSGTRGSPHQERQPLTGSHLVEAESPDAGRTGTQAWPRLALAEAEVRFGPHEPATQGALRTGRLEDGPDRSSSVTSGPANCDSGRPSKTAGGSPFPPIGGNKCSGIGTPTPQKPNVPARTRTWGLLLRRQSLYPSELRGLLELTRIRRSMVCPPSIRSEKRFRQHRLPVSTLPERQAPVKQRRAA